MNNENDDDMMFEIIKELTSKVDMSSVTNAQVLAWARRWRPKGSKPKCWTV